MEHACRGRLYAPVAVFSCSATLTVTALLAFVTDSADPALAALLLLFMVLTPLFLVVHAHSNTRSLIIPTDTMCCLFNDDAPCRSAASLLPFHFVPFATFTVPPLPFPFVLRAKPIRRFPSMRLFYSIAMLLHRCNSIPVHGKECVRLRGRRHRWLCRTEWWHGGQVQLFTVCACW